MLREQAHQLQQQIANLYLEFPELVGDDEVLRVDSLEAATNIKELLTVILHGIDDANILHDGTQSRLEELKARQARFAMRIDFLRAMMLKILDHAKLKKLELPEATLSVKAGTQKLIGDPDPETLADEFCRITRAPDKVKIRTALLNGADVPGFALSNAEPSLAVHVR